MKKGSLECEASTLRQEAMGLMGFDWRERLAPVDWIVLGYTAAVALFVAVFHEEMAAPSKLLAFHIFLIVTVLLIPPRGSDWETKPLAAPWQRHARGGLRFFRYGYPLLLILFFFEEVQHTVNAMWTDAPYWFERYLYAADRWLFGELPVILMNDWVGPLQNEILHGFYFSYYFILIGGVVIAWLGDASSPERNPGPGFQTTLTSAITAFVLCFVWYPILPARGPWENPELMAGLTPFQGVLFVPIIEKIIEQGAVSGGCFPSSHVAGSWAIVFALFRFHRKPALILGFLALGMSFACAYTRYHHAIDVPTGFLAGLLGSSIAARLVSRGRGSEAPAERGSHPEVVSL